MKTPHKRRWYDQSPLCSSCVELLVSLPEQSKPVVAQHMIDLAEEEFMAALSESVPKSLGQERVIGLYKSKNKYRQMDQEQTVHRAMNYFLILSDEDRLLMSRRMGSLYRLIYQYITASQSSGNPLFPDVINRIVWTYQKTGVGSATQLLEEILHRIQPKAPAEPKTLQDNHHGMKLQKKAKEN